MRKVLPISLLLVALLLFVVGVIYAQGTGQQLGTIQGVVYEDVDGDGQCVNTGVEGEGPVEGVDIEFVSSDEQTVIVLYSGPEGIYGMFAVGHSYWAVTAKPTEEWVVTSEPTLYAPIYPDSLVQTDINFCVQKASTVPVVLPESGAAASRESTTIAVLIGLGFVAAGVGLEWRRRFQ